MFDLEAELGMTWADIAQATYEIEAAIAEDRGHETPSWDDLPIEKKIARECGVRVLEAFFNNSPTDIEYWQKFASKRLSRRTAK